MNSMTGFGRAEHEFSGQKLSIEIKSVNHRFLDINIRMPRFMNFLEDDIRKTIKNRLSRGRVDLFVNYTDLGGSQKTVRPDISLIKAYMAAAEEVKNCTSAAWDITVNSLMRMPDALIFDEEQRDEDELKNNLIFALDSAIDKLSEARKLEGERICVDIFARIDALGEIIREIEKREPNVVSEYREKLKNRLSELLEDSNIDENRFNSEIVYFADKCSITEEIVRVNSHLAQCKDTLISGEACGRNMDFIVQELNREFNTIGSKSQDVAITKLMLSAKAEVEKIREQIQNIE